MEQNNTVVEPVVAETPIVDVKPVVEQDLTARLAEFKNTQKQAPVADNSQVDIGFDYKEIESIADPTAKAIALKAYKSMQAGVTKKFQEAAMTKKEADAIIAQSRNWSPERIQKELLSNPEFLAAAQQVSGVSQRNSQESTNDEYSVLGDKEKSVLDKVPSLENELNLLKQERFQAVIAQTDAQLQAKYGSDYNPEVIDNGIAEMARLQPHQIREYVYKAVNHKRDVEAAYRLGLQEKGQLNKEKINSISTDGLPVVNNDDVPKKEKGENDINFLVRLGQFRLAQSRRK